MGIHVSLCSTIAFLVKQNRHLYACMRGEKRMNKEHVAEKVSTTQGVSTAARKIYGLYIPLLEARFHF